MYRNETAERMLRRFQRVKKVFVAMKRQIQLIKCCIWTHLRGKKKNLIVFFWKFFPPSEFVLMFSGSLRNGGAIAPTFFFYREIYMHTKKLRALEQRKWKNLLAK